MNEEQLKALFGTRVKEIRKSRKLTQEKFSELIEIEPGHLCKIENGTHFPSLKTLIKLINILDVDISDVFDFDLQVEDKLLENIIYDIKQFDNKELHFLQDIIASMKKFRDK